MKHIVTLSFAACLILSPTIGHAQDTKENNSDNKTNPKVDGINKDKNTSSSNAPYTAGFSSRFEIGDPKNAAIVLIILKDFEENATDRHSDLFADTLTFVTPEGYVLKGKSQFLPGTKQYRASFANIKTSVEMFVSLRSIDRHTSHVQVRGSQEKTNKEGVKQIVDFHSVWDFDKDGKVTYIREYTARHPSRQ